MTDAPAARAGQAPPLVRAMLRPAFYPHRPRRVRLVQTHISWVFIAGDRVYKVKKPVGLRLSRLLDAAQARAGVPAGGRVEPAPRAGAVSRRRADL